MPTAVIYARQSSGSDDFSLSEEQQILNCKHLAADGKFNIAGIFQDLNTSGETYPAGAEHCFQVFYPHEECPVRFGDFPMPLYQSFF